MTRLSKTLASPLTATALDPRHDGGHGRDLVQEYDRDLFGHEALFHRKVFVGDSGQEEGRVVPVPPRERAHRPLRNLAPEEEVISCT